MFSDEARKNLGEAIRLAREGAGHPYRPSFAEFAGPPLGVRSLLKLEKGEPVGPKVYVAAGRALSRLYEDWSVEVPLRILRGEPAPAGVPRQGVKDGQGSTTGDSEAATDPNPADYPDMEDFLRAVFKQLRRQGVPHKAIMRAAARVAREIEQAAAEAERNGADTPRGEVG